MRPEEELAFLEEASRHSKHVESVQEQDTDADKIKLVKVTAVPKCEFLRKKVKTSATASLDSKSSSKEAEDEYFPCTLCPDKKVKCKKSHFRKFHKDSIIQVQIISETKIKITNKRRENAKANSLIDEIGDTASNSPNIEPNNNVETQQTSQQVTLKKKPKPKKEPKPNKVPVRKLLIPAPLGNNSTPIGLYGYKVVQDQHSTSLSDPDKALEELEKIEKTTRKILDDEETSERSATADPTSAPVSKKPRVEDSSEEDIFKIPGSEKKRIKKIVRKMTRKQLEEMRQEVDSYKAKTEKWQRRAQALSKQLTDLGTVMKKSRRIKEVLYRVCRVPDIFPLISLYL